MKHRFTNTTKHAVMIASLLTSLVFVYALEAQRRPVVVEPHEIISTTTVSQKIKG